MKYILYARKSEEDRNRQVQSIDDQVRDLRRLADTRGLTIVDEYRESRTAKEPGRPLFTAMLERIQQDKADGILVWSINRLTRNPVDEGTVKWLLQQGVIRCIQTMERAYLPEDNVLILSVDAGVANQFILDLRKGTLRGLNSKVEKGWFPHRAPEGYLNDTSKEQGHREIVVDPVRFPLLRRAWEMMLTGAYSVPQVLRALDTWGYTIKPHAKSPHNRMTRSALYRLFGNRFYAGYFLHNSVWYPGRHTPMVTEREFGAVQKIMGKPVHLTPKKHFLAYSGLMRCGRCGCLIVGEVKARQTRAGIQTHIYYHCTDSKRVCNKRGITQAALEDQIVAQLRRVQIAPQYRDLVFRILEREYSVRQNREEDILTAQQQALLGKRKELNTLVRLRLQEKVDDTLFEETRKELETEIRRLEGDIGETCGAMDDRRDVVENVLYFATDDVARRFFDYGVDERRITALHLGARYVLTEGNLALELNELLVPVADSAAAFERDAAAFERLKTGSASIQKQAFDRLCAIWGPRWARIRTIAVQGHRDFPRMAFPSDAT